MARLIVYIQDHERKALYDLAQREYRAPQAQAALILRNELERLGMISASKNIDTTPSFQEAQNGNARSS